MTTQNRVFTRHVMSNVSGRYNPPFIHALKKLLIPAELGDYSQLGLKIDSTLQSHRTELINLFAAEIFRPRQIS